MLPCQFQKFSVSAWANGALLYLNDPLVSEPLVDAPTSPNTWLAATQYLVHVPATPSAYKSVLAWTSFGTLLQPAMGIKWVVESAESQWWNTSNHEVLAECRKVVISK